MEESNRILVNENDYKAIGSKKSYKFYLETLLEILNNKQYLNFYKSKLEKAIVLGPQETDDDRETKITMLAMLDLNNKIEKIWNNYGENIYYDITDDTQITLNAIRNMKEYKDKIKELNDNKGLNGGNRRNKATPNSKAKPKHDDMTMKDIKELCKANQIKLSRVVEGKRIAYKKKELITKLKRKKLL